MIQNRVTFMPTTPVTSATLIVPIVPATQMSNLLNEIGKCKANEIKKRFNEAEALTLKIDDTVILFDLLKRVSEMAPQYFKNVKNSKDFAKTFFAKSSFSICLLISLSRFISFEKKCIIENLENLQTALILSNMSIDYHIDVCVICASLIRLIQVNNIKATRQVNKNICINKYRGDILGNLFALESIITNVKEEDVNCFYECVEDVLIG
jgi:hypothetical protein